MDPDGEFKAPRSASDTDDILPSSRPCRSRPRSPRNLQLPKPPETAGSLPADSGMFGFTLWTVVVILGLLMFMPVAVLGPIAEHLALQ